MLGTCSSFSYLSLSAWPPIIHQHRHMQIHTHRWARHSKKYSFKLHLFTHKHVQQFTNKYVQRWNDIHVADRGRKENPLLKLTFSFRFVKESEDRHTGISVLLNAFNQMSTCINRHHSLIFALFWEPDKLDLLRGTVWSVPVISGICHKAF